jgi:hypothetical protein
VFLISYPKWFRAHPTIFSITCWRSSGSTPSGRRRIVEPSVSPPHLAMARSGYRWPLWQARHLEGRSQLSARQVENEASYRMTPPSGFDAGSDIGNVRLREVGGDQASPERQWAGGALGGGSASEFPGVLAACSHAVKQRTIHGVAPRHHLVTSDGNQPLPDLPELEGQEGGGSNLSFPTPCTGSPGKHRTR